MAENAAEAAGRRLTGLVPERLIAAYVKLLAVGGIPKEQAEDFLGADVVRELCDRGLARTVPHTPDSPATFQATSPDLALLGVLADLQAQLSSSQQLLLEGQRRLTEMQSSPRETHGDFPGHLVKVLSTRKEVLDMSLHLINSARRDWMTFESFDTDMPVTDDYVIDCPAVMRPQLLIRSIYDLTMTEHPAGARIIRQSLAAGEQARVLPKVPMKMQLADWTAVLVPLTRTGANAALLIRAAPIIHALRGLFEAQWKQAMPLGGDALGGQLGETDMTIVRLMALGLQDQAIASRMKLAKSTVRRRIAAISRQLDAVGTNRFALGIAVQRSGLLDTDKESYA